MSNRTVVVRQTVMMIIMYVLGTAFLVAMGMEAGRDSWIAILLALAVSMVFVLIYARLISYFPGKDLFETMETLLGRPLTVIFLIPLALFLFQHYAYVMRHFMAFITEVGLPDAPRIVPLICLGLLSALGVYLGIEILGKWSEIFLIIVVAYIIVAVLLLTKSMDLNNLRPVLENGLTPIFKGTWSAISFPFAQTMAFLFILPPFENRKDPYKVFTIGLLLGGFLIFIPSVADVLVLGDESVARLYFPTYSSLAIIQLGQFIQRLEILAATIFTLAVFLKAAVLLMAVVKSIGRILGLKEYKFLLIPIMLMAINYSFISYDSIREQYIAIYTYWPYYSAIFQIVIPILLFILMEYKSARRKENTGQGLAASS